MICIDVYTYQVILATEAQFHKNSDPEKNLLELEKSAESRL